MMLKDLIARAFCREISRKLRRMGVLGAILGACFAFYVELPLETSIATKEAEIAMTSVHHSMDQMFLHLQRHALDTQLCHSKSRKEC
jgi:hypothetical protein